MPLKVEFPDGSEREVPSHKKEIKSREIGGRGGSVFIEEPDDDPDWRFVSAIGGKWFAQRRG